MAKVKKILETIAKRLSPVVGWFNSRVAKFTAVFRREILITLALALLVVVSIYADILFDVFVILALSALLFAVLRIIKIMPKKKKKNRDEKKTLIFGLTRFWLAFYVICVIAVFTSVLYEYNLIH